MATKLANLEIIAGRINDAHDEVLKHARSAVSKAVEVGELLSKAKAEVPHGKWGEWVERNCRFGARQAQKYLRIFDNRLAIRDQMRIPNSHLSVDRALAAIAEPTAPAAPDESADESLATDSTASDVVIEAHPLCSLIPDMTDEEFESLCCSIADHGLVNPIVTYKGKIIDGRQRLRACRRVGATPRYREYVPNEVEAGLSDEAIVCGYIEFVNSLDVAFTAEQMDEIGANVAALRAGRAAEAPISKSEAAALVAKIKGRRDQASEDWISLVDECLRLRSEGDAQAMDDWLGGFDPPMRRAVVDAADTPTEMSLTWIARRHPEAFGLDAADVAFLDGR